MAYVSLDFFLHLLLLVFFVLGAVFFSTSREIG